MTPTPRATSRRCRARGIDSSRRSMRPAHPPASAALPDAVRAHVIRDRRGHRPARLGPARAPQAPGLGIRQHPRRHRAGGRRLAHAGQAVPGRGIRRRPAHDRGAAAGRHERRAERTGAVRRPHRRTVELAGAHSDAARGGAHLGVRLQGQEHRRARHRARSSAPRTCSRVQLRRSGDQLRITVQLIAAGQRPARLVEVLRSAHRRHLPDRGHGVALGGRGAALELSADDRRAMGAAPAGKDGGLRAVLVGRARQRKRTAEDNLKAVEFFRRAVDADPQLRAGAHVAWRKHCSTACR